jgi:hypothetical protein
MIAMKAKMTAGHYEGIPSLRTYLWLSNTTEAVVILTRIYYELYVESDHQFLGFGEAFKRDTDDSETGTVYMCPKCEGIGVDSIFELSDQKIGIIEKSRAGKDAQFKFIVFLDARIRYLDNEDSQEFSNERLIEKVDVTVPKEEWEPWLDSWMANKRVLLVKKETLEKLNEALSKRNKADYDDLIQELVVFSRPTEGDIGEATTDGGITAVAETSRSS